MKRSSVILFYLFMALFIIQGQSRVKISGTVLDDENLPIPGVNIMIKGTTDGAITDIDGNYTISVSDAENTVLQVSFVGFENQEIVVGGRTKINIIMAPSIISLDEVVAIGYGTTTRRDLTGSVVSVKSKDVENVPVVNIAQALSGKLSGVQVQQADGAPGASTSIVIRGGTSITQSNEPLYIIDGFPSEEGLSTISPSDIESIDVLKDASSTAIYGARGANGVIVVTTKQGKQGKTKISYDMYYGFRQITKKLDVLKAEDFANLEYERATKSQDEMDRFVNIYGEFADVSETFANRPGIDWQDVVFDSQTPTTQMHAFNISGGSGGTNYYASYTRNEDGGIMEGSGQKKDAMRLRLNYKASDKLKTTFNVSYTSTETKGMGSLGDSGYFSRMRNVIQYRPTIGVKGEDSELLELDIDPLLIDDSGNTMVNPIASIEGEQLTRTGRYLNMNSRLEYKLLSCLTYNGSISLSTSDTERAEFYTERSLQAKRDGAPWGKKRNDRRERLNYNNTLTYKYAKNRNHKFDAMVGMEYYKQETTRETFGSRDFPEDNFGLNDMSLGITPMLNETDAYDQTMLSYFGRANYHLRNKYLFTVTFRADGSSKFGANNKWGYFPSGAFAWRMSEEPFIQNIRAISNLKLRVSYGTAGNNRIGNYASQASMVSDWTSFYDNMVIAYRNARLANPDLKWETNITRNIGLDAGLFRQRVEMSVDYYYNTTKDLLLAARLPLLAGFSSTMKNVGKTKNHGIEVNITTRNIERADFSWTTSFNISANKNEVVELYQSDHFFVKSGWATSSEFNANDYIVREGEPLGQMWGFHSAGIYNVDDFDFNAADNSYTLKEGIPYDPAYMPEPGSWKYQDVSGPEGKPDGIIDSNDMGVIGNTNPKFFGGIGNQFNYKGFDLSVFFNFSYGNDVYNANRMYYTKMSNRYKNAVEEVRDRFTFINAAGENVKNNPEALAALNQGKDMASIQGSSKLVLSSRYIEDGSFLRLNNVSLGYTVPKSLLKKVGIQSLRFYATAYNLKTWTNYTGFDPEVNSRPNGNLSPGIDWGAYPRSFSTVFGLNLTL